MEPGKRREQSRGEIDIFQCCCSHSCPWRLPFLSKFSEKFDVKALLCMPRSVGNFKGFELIRPTQGGLTSDLPNLEDRPWSPSATQIRSASFLAHVYPA